jgi:hypothetical protein
MTGGDELVAATDPVESARRSGVEWWFWMGKLSFATLIRTRRIGRRQGRNGTPLRRERGTRLLQLARQILRAVGRAGSGLHPFVVFPH